MTLGKYNNRPHYMQSEAFSEYMQFLNWETYVLGSKKHPTFLYVHPFLYGSVAKIPKGVFPLPLDEISDVIRKRNIQVCRVEPNVLLPRSDRELAGLRGHVNDHGFGKTWFSGESQSIVVDLTPPDDDLFGSIPRENTRRNIRQAQKLNLTTMESDDVELAIDLHRSLAKRKGFFAPSANEMRAMWQAFRKRDQATVVTVSDKKGYVWAAILLILYQGTAHYRFVGYAPGAEEFRAPSLAVWESFLIAKKHGCTRFDFTGINDSRSPNKKWQGFTQFKYGFSDNTITYLEPFGYYAKPFASILHLFDRFG